MKFWKYWMAIDERWSVLLFEKLWLRLGSFSTGNKLNVNKMLLFLEIELMLAFYTIVMLFPFKRIWSSLVTRLPSAVVSNSKTSSNTMLTKSSNPSKVPTISLSFFMIMWILEPIHLSTNSNENKKQIHWMKLSWNKTIKRKVKV